MLLQDFITRNLYQKRLTRYLAAVTMKEGKYSEWESV